MKKLTIAQAARELNSLANQRLTGTPEDGILKTRIEQFTSAVDLAVTQLQSEVQRLRKDLDALKK